MPRINKYFIIKALLISFSFTTLFSQSIVPKQQSGGTSWLQNTSTAGLGDQDQINVIFFEIPDTVTSTLYFAVNDAGTDNQIYNGTPPDENSGLTDFYLIGNTGVLSDSNSRLIDYSSNKSLSRTGTILSSFTADDEAEFNDPANIANQNGWYYFPVGVDPTQGEHIGNKYYFKVVAEAYLQQNEITEVTCPVSPADESYFYLYETTGTPIFYYVWFDTADDGTFDGVPPGGTGIRVANLTAPWTNSDNVASDLATAIDAEVDFGATVTGSTVTITNAANGAVTDAFDAASGVTFNVTQEGSSNLKNAYQINVSTTNTAEPTGVTGAKSFAYSLNLALLNDIDAGAEWSFYPFVPDSALDTDFVMYHNFDFDAAETLETQTLTSYAGLTDPTASANGGHSVEGYELSPTETASGSGADGERNGTWQLFIFETDGTETNQNSSEIWFTLDADGDWNTETDGDPFNMDNDAVPLRIYNEYFVNPADPDHIAVSVDDGVAITTSGSEVVSFQTVDTDGTPLPFVRDVWFDFSATHPNVLITATSSAGVISAQNALVTTSSDGVGWIEISDTSSETVTVEPITDGLTGGSDPLSGTNETADVVFQLNPDPVLSSQFNTSFVEGNTVTLPNITITDGGTSDITAGNDIRIHIPTGLDAVFADVAVTCTVTGTGEISGANPFTGNLTYEDGSKTAVLNVTTGFAVTDSLLIEGLQFTAVNTDSIGNLEMSVTGATPFPIIDDKFITIEDSNTTYIWQGTTNSWNTATNWLPNGIPDLNTENAIIPDTANDPDLDTTGIAINNLTINSGASVAFNSNAIDIDGSFNNDGTLFLVGDEVTNISTKMDIDSGTVEYTGAGTALNGGDNYYNIDFAAGSWDLTSALTVYNDLVISGAVNLDSGGFSINVSGDWNNQVGTTAYTHSNNTVIIDDNSKPSQVLGSTIFYDLTSTTSSKTIQFENGQTQTIDTNGTITLTGSAGNLIVLQSTSSGNFWTIQNDGAGQSIDYVSVQDGDVTGSGLSLYAANSSDISGNNTNTPAVPIWDFTPTSTWTGTTDTDWSDNTNWLGAVPTAGIHAIIPDVSGVSGNFPELTAASFTNDLTIESGASLDIVQNSLTVSGTFSNEGILYRAGAGTIDKMDTDSGTVVYRDVTGNIEEYGTPDYFNLEINGAGQTFSAGADLDIDGSLTITAGDMASSTGYITVDGASSLGGNISTTNSNLTLTGAVTLTASSQLSTDTGIGNIQLGTTAAGAGFDFIVNAGTGGVSFGGNLGSFVNLSITNGGVLALPSITATGDLTIVSGGNITDNAGAAINVSGLGDITSTGSILLGDIGGDVLNFNTLNLAGTDITITEDSAMVLVDVDASLTFTATSEGGPQTIESTFQLNTGNIDLTAASSIILSNTNSVFGTISADGGSVQIAEGDPTDLGTISATVTDLTITSTGLISDSGVISVVGDSFFTTTAGNSDIILDQASDFAGAVSFVTDGTGSVSLTNVTTATDLGASTVGGTFDIESAGDLTDSGTLLIDGNSTFTAPNTFSIILDEALNNFDTTSTVGFLSGGTLNDVTVVDQDAFDIQALTISGALNVLTAGAITQSGAISTAGNIDIASTGSTINLSNSITTTTNGNTTITNNGLLTISGVMNLDGTFLQDGVGPVTISSDITTTSDNIQFDSAITLAEASTSVISTGSASAGNISITSISGTAAGIGENLTLLSGNGTTAVSGTIGTSMGVLSLQDGASSGAVSFAGDVTTATLTTFAAAYPISFNGGGTITTDTDFLNTGALTLGDDNLDTITFTGGLDTTTGPSGTNIAGTVLTTNTQMDLGAVTLTDTAELDTGTAAGSILNIGAVTSGANALTLDSGPAAAISVTSFAGGGDLTIRDSDDTTFTGVVAAGAVTLTDSTGTIAFQGNTTATGLTTAAQGYGVSFTGAANTIGGITTFSNSGTLTLGDLNTDSIAFTGGVIATSGPKSIAGTVSAAGTGVINLGTTAVSVTDDSLIGGTSTGLITVGPAIIANGATLTVGTGVNADINCSTISGIGGGGVSNLTIDTLGAVTVGNLGTDFGTVTVVNSGGVTFSGTFNANNVVLTDTTGVIAFQGNTTVNTGLTAAAQGFDVSFTGTTSTIAGATDFQNTGDVTIGNNNGDSVTFAGGMTHTAGTTNIHGQLLSTNTNIDLGAVVLPEASTSVISTGSATAGNIAITTISGTGGGVGENLTLLSGTGTTAVSGAIGTSMGTLSLQDGASNGAVSFAGDVTTATLTTFAGAYPVSFNGGGTITTDTNFLNTGALTLGNGAGDAITFTGGLDTTTGPSGTSIAGTVATTATDMDLNGTTLTAAATLDSAGGNITIASLGGAFDLTLAAAIAGGTTTVTGAVTGLGDGTGAALTVANGVTGLVLFQGTVGGASGFVSSATSNVRFDNDVTLTNGDTGTNLAGNVQLDGLTFSCFDGLTLGALTLSTAAVTLDSNTGNILIGSVAGGAQDLFLESRTGTTTISGVTTNVGTLTLHDDNAASTGAMTFTGSVTANIVATWAQGYDVSFNGGGTITTDTTFLNTGALTLGDDNLDTITFIGGLDTTTGPSGTNIAGTVLTTNTQMDLGAVTLTDTAELDTGTAAGSILNIGAVTSGANALTLDSGPAAAISVTSFAGGGDITIRDSDDTTFTGVVAAGAVTLTDSTGTIAFQGNTTVTGLTTAAQGYGVSFTGAANTIGGITTFSNSGTLTLGDLNTDSIAFTGGVIASSGPKSIAGTVSAAGTGVINLGTTAVSVTDDSLIGGTSTGLITVGPVIIADGATLTVGTGVNADINCSTISGIGGGGVSNLTIDTLGAVTVGNLGTDFGTVTVVNSGGVTFSGTFNANNVVLTDTTGVIAFQGNTTVNTGLTAAAQGFDVSFTGTTSTIAGATDFQNTGDVTIGNNNGDSVTYAGGMTHTAGTTNIHGQLLSTNTNIDLGAVVLPEASTSVISTGSATAGNIAITTISGTGGGVGENLTLLSGTGTTAVSGAIGTSMGTLSLQDGASNGAVSFAGDVTTAILDTFAGAYPVSFNGGGTITTDTNFLNTGALTLGNGAGDAITFTGGLDTTTGPSGTSIAGTVATTNNPMDLNGTTLTAAATLDSAGGNITIASLGGAFDLTLAAAIAGGTTTVTGAVTGLGDGTGAALTVANGVTGLVLFQGTVGGASGFVSSASSNVRFDNDVTLTNGDTGTNLAGNVQLDGLTFSCFDGLTLGALTLSTAAVTLDSNTGNILIGSVAGGAQDLFLESRTGTTTVSGVTTNVGTLTLHDDNAASTGAMTFDGSVSANTVTTYGRGYDVTFNGGGTITTDTDFLNTGVLTLGDDNLDAITFTGGLDTTTGPSGTSIAGTVATTNNPMDLNGTTLTAAATLDSAGGNITIASLGGAFDLTLAAAIAGGTTTVTGAVTGLGDGTGAALTVANGVTGLVLFQGTVGGASGFVSSASSNVRFDNDVTLTNGDTGTNLAGNVQLDGLTFSCFDGLTLGALTLSTAAVTLDSNTGNILIGSVAGGAQDLFLESRTGTTTVSGVTTNVGTLTLHDDNAASTGAMTFTGSVTANTVATWAQGYDVSFNGGGTITTDTTFLNTGALTLGDDNLDTITFIGGLDTTTGPSGTNIAGTVLTTNTQMDLGAVTLTDTAELDTGTAAGSILNIGAVTSGANALTLDSGPAAAISVTSFAGGGDITIRDSDDTTFTGVVAAGAVTLTDSTGTIAFQGNTTVTGLTTAAQGYGVSFTGAANTIGGITTFSNSGTLTLGDLNTDSIAFTGGVIASSGPKSIAGTVSAAGTGVINLGTTTVSVTDDSLIGGTSTGLISVGPAIIANGATLTVGTGVNADINCSTISGIGGGGVSNLTIDTLGAVTVGNLGTDFGTVTVVNSGGVTFSGTFDANNVVLTDTTGAISFSGNTTVNTGLTAAAQGFDVSFTGTTSTIAGATDFQNTGDVTIGNNNGDSVTFAGGMTHTAGTTNIHGQLQTTNTDINLGAVVLPEASTSVISTGSATAGNIAITTISGTGGGVGENLTLLSGTGTTAVSGAVGTSMGTLSLQDGASNGAVSFAGDVITAILDTFAGAYPVSFNGGGTITTDTNFLNTGALTLGNGAGDAITFTGGLDTTTGPSGTSIAGTVATTNNPMDLNGTTLTAAATLDSAGGNITIASLGGAFDLTLAAAIAGGTTTVTGAVTGLGDGTGAALTVANGVTGLVLFQGAVGGASGFVSSASSNVRFDNDVTLTNGDTGTNLAGNVQLDGLTFSCFDGLTLGALTLSTAAVTLDSNTGNILIGSVAGGAQDLFLESRTGTTTVSGVTTNVGTLTLHDDNAASTGAMTFTGSVTANTVTTWAQGYDVSFNGGGTIATATTFNNNGAGILTLGNDNLDTITFTAGMTATAPASLNIAGTIDAGAGVLNLNAAALNITANSLIGGAAGVNITLGPTVLADSVTLTLGSGNSTPVSTSTIDGTGPLASPDSNLVFDTNVSTITLGGAINTDIGNLEITSGNLDAVGFGITIFGNWVNSGTFTHNSNTVTFAGSGTITSNGSSFYDVIISGTTYVLSDDMEIDNNLTTSGTFQPGNHQITINGTTWTTTGTFDHSGLLADLNRKVIFTNIATTIIGSNTFQDFEYIKPAGGGTILFGNVGTQTITKDITIEGAAGVGNEIYLNRTPAAGYWYLNLGPSATALFRYVIVDWCDASGGQTITPDPTTTFNPPIDNNINWYFSIPIVESWTEDAVLNGRIDRIRVRVSEAFNISTWDYSDLNITVDNYTVTGFTDGTVNYEFFIELAEKIETDTGVLPPWRIVSNTTLAGSGGALVSTEGVDEIPQDNAAPVIDYSLSSIEKDRIFIVFSEPVTNHNGGWDYSLTDNDPDDDPADLTFGDITYDTGGGNVIIGWDTVTTENDASWNYPTGVTGVQEIELMLSEDVQISDVLANTTFSIDVDLNDIHDFDVPAECDADIVATTSVFTEAFLATNETHRVSDLALGLTGDAILQPVYATDEAETDSSRGGIGLIHNFDGTEFLQDQAIEITTHVNNLYPAATTSDPDVKLIFDVDIPLAYRQNGDSDGLWLPSTYNIFDFYGIVPDANPDANATNRTINTATSPSANLRTHNLDNTDPELKSVAMVEFLYFFDYDGVGGNPGLFGARIENSSASDWYRQIKPWSFEMHDITSQVGGVTILNNVINPENGETANLHYELASDGMVTIQVFDISGAMVDVLNRGRQAAGDYSTAWDGRNSGGRVVARGVYFIRIVAPGIDETRKVMVVK